ncbi:cuticle protein CP14.6-like [Contarinia nasturtii]|uniref:cuticle protein CP14.6-like n=1 Tax=Contarinia nasturtii TaxID=265458 RepID=UPI0012D4286A|nr:cuticle protein CP14.6-like [Contarinia nasturtii]
MQSFEWHQNTFVIKTNTTNPNKPHFSTMKTFVVLFAVVAVALAAPQSQDQSAETLRFDSAVNPESYNYAYETSNQIKASESGQIKQVGSESAITAQGEYSYIAPDGTPVKLSYIADENGFQPQSELLPVAPAIPEQIQRALEYIAAHPQPQQK